MCTVSSDIFVFVCVHVRVSVVYEHGMIDKGQNDKKNVLLKMETYGSSYTSDIAQLLTITITTTVAAALILISFIKSTSNIALLYVHFLMVDSESIISLIAILSLL